jgi:hypothetical protein
MCALAGCGRQPIASAHILQQQQQRGRGDARDALRRGDRGRPRRAELLAVLGRQLHRAIVQIRRELQRLPARQLSRLRCLRSRAEGELVTGGLSSHPCFAGLTVAY